MYYIGLYYQYPDIVHKIPTLPGWHKLCKAVTVNILPAVLE